MYVIYRQGEASVTDVRDNLPDPPGYSAVRALLVLLEGKGYVRHRKVGRAYLYKPVVSRDKTRYAALRQMIHTFFDGSVENVVAALLGSSPKLSEDELVRIEKLIKEKRGGDKE